VKIFSEVRTNLLSGEPPYRPRIISKMTKKRENSRLGQALVYQKGDMMKSNQNKFS